MSIESERQCRIDNMPMANRMTDNYDRAQAGDRSAATALMNEVNQINASGGKGCATPENLYTAIYNVQSDKPGNTALQMNMNLDRSAGPTPEDAKLTIDFPKIKGYDK